MAEMTPEGSIQLDVTRMSEGELAELQALGILSENREIQSPPPITRSEAFEPVVKKAIEAPEVLNEAYCYSVPSSFSRGLRLELGDTVLIFISGTASVDEAGKTVHLGDFRAQCWRTYRNISKLLASEGATWQDIVKTTCFLRDIERDYLEFNRVRTAFFQWHELDPLPASVGVQTRLCREDLLVEIEAIAVLRKK